jgi:hypothetical protein
MEKRPDMLSLREMMAQRSSRSDKYTEKEIAQDAIWCAKNRMKDVVENTERANLLQELFVRNAANVGWFGKPETTQTIRTSEYDDRHNFVDMVVAFQHKDGAHSHLAIDLIAAAHDSKALAKKKVGIERKIVNGKHAEVKYLPEQAQPGQFVVRHIENTPQVIIGITPSTVTEISEKLFAYYYPDRALNSFREKHGLKAYQKEHPQSPIAMKEYARQELANHPIAYEIAQESFAQLESQALLALNVFLDRAGTLLQKQKPEYAEYLDKIKGLEEAISDFRTSLTAEPDIATRDSAVAALERIYKLLTEFTPLANASGYHVQQVIRPLIPYIKYFGNLANTRQSLAAPEKEDPTVKILSRPWESSASTRQQLAA